MERSTKQLPAFLDKIFYVLLGWFLIDWLKALAKKVHAFYLKHKKPTCAVYYIVTRIENPTDALKLVAEKVGTTWAIRKSKRVPYADVVTSYRYVTKCKYCKKHGYELTERCCFGHFSLKSNQYLKLKSVLIP